MRLVTTTLWRGAGGGEGDPRLGDRLRGERGEAGERDRLYEGERRPLRRAGEGDLEEREGALP